MKDKKTLKNFKIIFILVIAISMLSIKIFALDGKFNTGGINFRKEPNTSSAILDSFDKGDEVKILSKDGNWYKIETKKGGVGYVSAEYLDEVKQDDKNEIEKTAEIENKEKSEIEEKTDKKTETADKKEEPSGQKIKLKTDLDIYSLPIYFSKVLKNVKAGDEVLSLDKMGIWEKIKTEDGYFGWVLQSDLK